METYLHIVPGNKELIQKIKDLLEKDGYAIIDTGFANTYADGAVSEIGFEKKNEGEK